MTGHSNEEDTVYCPVEGCGKEVLARGINLHVRRSSGGGHGPQGDVPDHISFDNLETVSTESVEMDYPEERDTEQVMRLCPYCERPFRGKQGVLIHLGQVKGRKNHPESYPDDLDSTEFTVVQLDDHDNIVEVVGEPDTSSEQTEADQPAFAQFSKDELDYISKVIYEADIEDERVRALLQRPYVENM